MSHPNLSAELLPLPHLAVIEFAGPDAASFLHGQLSNDVLGLADGQSQLASFNSPKGRVIAVLHLTRDAGRFLAVLPGELADLLIERLRKYVLRAKVTLRLCPELLAYGNSNAPQTMIVRAAMQNAQAPESTSVREDWKRARIAAGLPQVYPATSEMFVAQMLNLDRVEGISFRKGCYTGQEIIARTQNLGRIKRRMLRFATSSTGALAPGDTIILDSIGNAMVVEVAAATNGDREFLAVVHLDTGIEDAKAATHPRFEARELPLPYAIPERTT